MEAASAVCGVDFYANIKITDDDEVKELNAEFRSIDETTDVLSFPAYELEKPLRDCIDDIADLVIEDDLVFIGDIAISLEAAKRQAGEYGHSLLRETAFLAVHGVLHLLGYDHQNEAEERRMIELQKEIMSQAGIER